MAALHESAQTPDMGPDAIGHVMEYFAKNSHRQSMIRLSHTVTDDELKRIQQHCTFLLSKDYVISTIPNHYGELCTSYPPELILLENELSGQHGDADREVGPQVNDVNVLKPMFEAARFARAHGRFVYPVILVRNKNICRSGTISCNAETMLNNMQQRTKSLIYGLYGEDAKFETPDAYTLEDHRGNDIALLQKLEVHHITDLMVEQRRRKLGMVVCSSEKAETSNKYRSSFNVMPVPFPGCEFFADFKRNDHNGNGLVFNWDLPELDAELDIPPGIASLFPWDWSKQKEWDLTTLAQRYLHLMLLCVADPEETHGLLVHCISGWDRTPVFISLLRMVLWAEGEIHTSLTPDEMLYLTIGYDWLLFSHHLSDRGTKGEDIFYFCFHFLEFLESPEFSVRHWGRVGETYFAEREQLAKTRHAPVPTDSEKVANAPHVNQMPAASTTTTTTTNDEDVDPIVTLVDDILDQVTSDNGEGKGACEDVSPPEDSTAASTSPSVSAQSEPLTTQRGFNITPSNSDSSAPASPSVMTAAPNPDAALVKTQHSSQSSGSSVNDTEAATATPTKVAESLLSLELAGQSPPLSASNGERVPSPAAATEDTPGKSYLSVDGPDDDERRVRAVTLEPGADGLVDVVTPAPETIAMFEEVATSPPTSSTTAHQPIHDERIRRTSSTHDMAATPHSLNSGGGSWQMVSEHLRDTEFARRNRKDSDPSICATGAAGDVAVSQSSLERSTRLHHVMNARAEAEMKEKEWTDARSARLRALRERFFQLYGQRVGRHLGAQAGGWGLFKTLGIV